MSFYKYNEDKNAEIILTHNNNSLYTLLMTSDAPTHRPSPTIFEFLEARAYLAAVYEYRKGQDPSFSYATWADELGFQSRSFVRLLAHGERRITPSVATLLVRGLRLSLRETEYFRNLVEFSQSTDSETRARAERKLLQTATRPHSRGRVVHDTYVLLSSYLAPRVQALAEDEAFPRTVEAFATTLSVDEKSVRTILESLERLHLVERAGEKAWRSTSTVYEVEDHLGDIALQSFHRNSLQEALRAIDRDPSTRNYQAAVLRLSEGQYEELTRELHERLVEIVQRFSRSREPATRLYQMNYNILAVSEPFLRAPQPATEDRMIAKKPGEANP